MKHESSEYANHGREHALFASILADVARHGSTPAPSTVVYKSHLGHDPRGGYLPKNTSLDEKLCYGSQMPNRGEWVREPRSVGSLGSNFELAPRPRRRVTDVHWKHRVAVARELVEVGSTCQD
jgi:hypothetical protein